MLLQIDCRGGQQHSCYQCSAHPTQENTDRPKTTGKLILHGYSSQLCTSRLLTPGCQTGVILHLISQEFPEDQGADLEQLWAWNLSIVSGDNILVLLACIFKTSQHRDVSERLERAGTHGVVFSDQLSGGWGCRWSMSQEWSLHSPSGKAAQSGDGSSHQLLPSPGTEAEAGLEQTNRC